MFLLWNCHHKFPSHFKSRFWFAQFANRRWSTRRLILVSAYRSAFHLFSLQIFNEKNYQKIELVCGHLILHLLYWVCPPKPSQQQHSWSECQGNKQRQITSASLLRILISVSLSSFMHLILDKMSHQEKERNQKRRKLLLKIFPLAIIGDFSQQWTHQPLPST